MIQSSKNAQPEHWVVAKLGDLNDLNPRFWEPDPADDEPVSFVPMAAVEEESGTLDPSIARPAREVRKGYTRFQDGDVLFAKITPCMENGKFALATKLIGGRGAGSTEFHVLRPSIGLNSKYLLFFLFQGSLRREARVKMKGAAGQLRVPPEFLSELAVPLPPYAEQARIVAEIEKQFTRLDAAVAALKRVQANLKRYRASVLKAACEGRLVPTEAELARREGRPYEPASELLQRILAARRSHWDASQIGKSKKPAYKEPPSPVQDGLPSLPEGWTWASLDQLAFIGTGATPLRSKDTYYSGGSIAWITSSALNRRYVNEATEYVTERALQETNLTLYPAGVLLIAMYGEGKTRGKCAELRIAATTNQAIAAIRFDESSLDCKNYVRLLLEKNYLDIRRQSSGGVQPNLNLSLVRSIAVPVPPAAEQERVVAEVERRLSVTDELEMQVEANLMRAERLRQAILKRAFEGKLVPQDPNDEPAGILLERIRAEREKRGEAQKTNRNSKRISKRKEVARA